MTACFIGLVACLIDFCSASAAYSLYFSGPPVSLGSWRPWPSAKIAKNWPPGARFGASPVPVSVSVIGYVAKLDHHCSPSETIGDPVASMRSIDSFAAASCSLARSSLEMLPASYSA